MRRQVSLFAVVFVLLMTASIPAAEPALPAIKAVEPQPLLAQVRRLQQAMDYLGSPLPEATKTALGKLAPKDGAEAVANAVQKQLDPLCAAAIVVGKDGEIRVVAAPHKPQLVEQGWRIVLVKVINHAESTGALRVDSPNARPVPTGPKDEIESRWLELSTWTGQPLTPNLSGLELEYRVIQLFSRDAGERKANLDFRIEGGKASPAVREWRFEKGEDGWKATNQCKLETEKGSLKVTNTGNDPYLTTAVEARPGEFALRFWATFDKPGGGQVFWWTKDQKQAEPRQFTNFRIVRGKAQEYEVKFRSTAPLAGLRIDTGSANGGIATFDWITLARADAPGPASYRAEVTFDCRPSIPVTFRVLDDAGSPTMGCFVIRDKEDQVYPAQSKRLAPDFFFHAQIYRETGETVRLPAGEYTVHCSRGPEVIPEIKKLTVGDNPVTLVYQTKRWIDPAKGGWYSGDHHIHAAGCQHYDKPTEGVHPPDMFRHILGEDLKVGCCLTWGPCFDYQKRFFSGRPDPVSKGPYLLRYDVEVSGFGSHVSGHLCLLRLQEQIPPGGKSKDHWPTLGLNTLRWAKKQGAVCGPAHSASGLTNFVGQMEGKEGPNRLPNFRIPAYDGIGANEFIMNVPHEVPGPDGKPLPAIDFISTMNTDRTAEFNMWYHVLNCGFRVKASGETDFPCVSGERVGMGRVYVKLDGKLDYDRWCQGIADGRSYVSDGTVHLMDLTAEPAGEPKQRVEMGVKGSELRLEKAGTVKLTVQAAARKPGGQKVPVELIVNGYPVARQDLMADGELRELAFEADVTKSSWLAVRVFPSAHTNPIFVLVDGKPIRASKASAEWCLRGVEQCWKTKKGSYREDEVKDAEEGYEHARKVYRKLRDESSD